jgi:hypothetical protein
VKSFTQGQAVEIRLRRRKEWIPAKYVKATEWAGVSGWHHVTFVGGGEYERVPDARIRKVQPQPAPPPCNARTACLGATVGELKAALNKLPAEMTIVVRAPDGVVGAIWNAGPDTGCVEDEDGNAGEFFAIEISDDPAFLRAEDERRRGGQSSSRPPCTHLADKDRQLALAVAIKALNAKRDPFDDTRWVYFAEETSSWWSVTSESLLRLVEISDRTDLSKEGAEGAAYAEWAETDETAVERGRRLPRPS